ncbi:MAG: ATP-binding protein [Nitrospiraceae bacterium]
MRRRIFCSPGSPNRTGPAAPPVLEELGLKAGLEALIADVQARTGLRCSLEFERRERRAARSPTVETAIYRVVQELLTNVIRWRGATQVAVVVHESRREWRLTVKDDGIGFDVAALSLTGGFDCVESGSGLRSWPDRWTFSPLLGRRDHRSGADPGPVALTTK